MDREKIITIGIGLAVGIGLAASYFAAVKFLPQLSKKPADIIVPSTSPNPNQTAGATTFDLTISQPDDYSSVTESSLIIAGKTLPQLALVIFANAEEKIATSDAAGNFSTSIKLEEGENEISVTAFDEKNNPVTLKRHVTLEVAQ